MQDDIDKAVNVLQRGGLVGFPTETVYGLGADANNPKAIANVFAAKERPSHHPLIVHLANAAELSAWAIHISEEVKHLAAAFWPGPLTLILKKRPSVLTALTGGQETVGLRVPQHPVALALLSAFGGGIAAPSANKFTHVSPTSADAVKEELGSRVDFILDGGRCEVGLESTIVDMSTDHPRILRPGKVTAAMIADVLGRPLRYQHQNEVRAPGMHPLHYAPHTHTQRMTAAEIMDFILTLDTCDLPIVFITHGNPCIPTRPGIGHVKMPDTPALYAHALYQTLRALDHQHFKRIVIEAVPAGEEWAAIQDRLSKASRC